MRSRWRVEWKGEKPWWQVLSLPSCKRVLALMALAAAIVGGVVFGICSIPTLRLAHVRNPATAIAAIVAAIGMEFFIYYPWIFETPDYPF